MYSYFPPLDSLNSKQKKSLLSCKDFMQEGSKKIAGLFDQIVRSYGKLTELKAEVARGWTVAKQENFSTKGINYAIENFK